MPDSIHDLIARVLNEVIEERTKELRAEVARRVAEQLGSTAAPASVVATATAPGGGGDATARLNSAIQRVQSSTSQAEILTALLEGAAGFAGRVALFVTRGSNAVGWKARGLDDESAVKRINLDANAGLAARALQDRMPVSAAAGDFSSEMVGAIGNPADGNCVVLPLLVREKVPALLYADGGAEGARGLDSSALDLLTRTAGLWLEVVATRRSTPAEGGERMAEPALAPIEKVVESPMPPVPQPEPPVLPADRVQESVAELTTPAPAVAAAAAAAPPPVAAAPPPATAAPATTAEDQEVHRKAKRFAKLLVDEIKLYNKDKVAEGRKKKDLYQRLRDDIDKSRATYDKRYGSTAAASADYFNQELVRILADNDASLLGADFQQ